MAFYDVTIKRIDFSVYTSVLNNRLNAFDFYFPFQITTHPNNNTVVQRRFLINNKVSNTGIHKYNIRVKLINYK